MTGPVVLVGCGNMGRAMLAGWIASGKLSPADALVVEPAEALREKAAALGATVMADAGGIGADAAPRLVVFAVKPQVILDVIPAYARFKASATYVSVAAGTPVAAFERALGADAGVLRCMPNTPAAIGKGMMVTYANPHVTPQAAAFIADLLSASGRVTEIVSEELMDAVTAVSGSGPAYIFHFIECLTAAAQAAGLPEETAKLLAMQTVYGAASLAEASSEEPAELRRQVTSPNGTTAAALSVLMGEDRLKTLLTDAVEAARIRAVELRG